MSLVITYNNGVSNFSLSAARTSHDRVHAHYYQNLMIGVNVSHTFALARCYKMLFRFDAYWAEEDVLQHSPCWRKYEFLAEFSGVSLLRIYQQVFECLESKWRVDRLEDVCSVVRFDEAVSDRRYHTFLPSWRFSWYLVSHASNNRL